MLIRLLMDLLKSLILGVLQLLPALPDFGWMTEYVDSVLGLIRSVNMVVSLPVAGACLLAVLVCYNARAIWSVVMWVIRKIPGVS